MTKARRVSDRHVQVLLLAPLLERRQATVLYVHSQPDHLLSRPRTCAMPIFAADSYPSASSCPACRNGRVLPGMDKSAHTLAVYFGCFTPGGQVTQTYGGFRLRLAEEMQTCGYSVGLELQGKI